MPQRSAAKKKAVNSEDLTLGVRDTVVVEQTEMAQANPQLCLRASADVDSRVALVSIEVTDAQAGRKLSEHPRKIP